MRNQINIPGMYDVTLLLCVIWFVCILLCWKEILETWQKGRWSPCIQAERRVFRWSYLELYGHRRDRLLQVPADHQSAYSSYSQQPGRQAESGCAAASISGSESCESSLFCLLTEDALSPLSLYVPLLPSSLPLFVSPTTALFGGSVFLWKLGNNLCLLDKSTNVFLCFEIGVLLL